MIKHIVMFKVRNLPTNLEKERNIQRIKTMLEALPPKIHEIKFFEVGVNFANNGLAYDLVLNSAFASKEDLLSYQRHPEHLKVADFVNQVCESRVVVDYVI